MSIPNSRQMFDALLVAAGLLCGAAATALAQQGTITGRVIDQATQQPLVGAQVSILGTTRRVLTDQAGA